MEGSHASNIEPPTQAAAGSIRLQLGTDIRVLIAPGRQSCAGEPIAYSVNQAARVLGLSKAVIYDQLRSNRLGSVKIGKRRIITRQQIDAWLAGFDS